MHAVQLPRPALKAKCRLEGFNVKLRKSAMALQNFLKNEELREEPPLYKGSLVSFNVDGWTVAA